MVGRRSSGGDYSARILGPLLLYVREKFGEEKLRELIASAGPGGALALAPGAWIGHAEFEAILASASALLADHDEFERACAHELRKAYGPILLLLRATSTRALYRLMALTMRYMSRVSTYEVVDSRRGTVTMRYASQRPESRLMCDSRRAQFTYSPTVFGLAKVHVQERSCIARGDACCEYTLRWVEKARWSAVAMGALAGAALGQLLPGVLGALVPIALSVPVLMPLLGAAAAWVFELHRAQDVNAAANEEVNAALREVAEEAMAAREEVMALSERQARWSEQLEEQVDERTQTLADVVTEVRRVREERVVSLRGFSHDLRNPLSVLRANLVSLKTGDTDVAIADDALAALGQIDALLERLLQSTMADAALAAFVPEQVEVAPLTEKIRRRLRAFVSGRDIRTSVLPTREAPVSIVTDKLIFERIIDNLLSNAAKYTTRGSIVVEIGGAPGLLCLKVSDTGTGISEERIERVFATGGAGPSGHPDSHGIGLAGVARLLGRLGGRLEVMSKPEVGSTFWAYLPVALPQGTPRPHAPEEPGRDLLERVVTIRRIHS